MRLVVPQLILEGLTAGLCRALDLLEGGNAVLFYPRGYDPASKVT